MAEKAKRRRRKRGGLVDSVNGLLSLVLLALLVAAGVVVFGAQRFYNDGPAAEESVFMVERGSGLSSVAQRLEDAGLVRDRWTFQFGTLAQREQSNIKAGEFRIPANASMADILTELTEGTPITYAVTVPEGFTSWQTAERINSADILLGDPVEVPEEGSLLPNTYHYERGDTRQAVLERMRAELDAVLPEIWENRDPGLPLESPEELVTLASIIEKETAVPEERPMIAGVFVNRLERGMRLQSDPTIIYGITEGEGTLGRGLRRSEIEEETAYNTYQIDGLPPGPIANPGIESLRAAANPAETDALYFVADGSGGHAFAATYDEHRENVARWREIEEERQAQEAEAAEAEEAEQARQELEAQEAEEADGSADEAPGEESPDDQDPADE